MHLGKHQTAVPARNPPCTRCAATDVKIALQTPLVFYYRCAICSEVWTVPRLDLLIIPRVGCE